MNESLKSNLLLTCIKRSLFIPIIVGTVLLTGCDGDSSNTSNSASNSNSSVVDNSGSKTNDPSLYLADTPKIMMADNFRDISGNSISTNYVNTDGLKLRRGLIYRSNYLPLNETDLETFKSLKIQTVYDLRTNSEREKSPDILSPETNIIMINITGTSDSALPPGINTPEDMINIFGSSVANMAAHDEGAQQRYGAAINSLIYTDGVQVFHCTAGKDRTGWLTATIQLLLGMSYNDALKDYLLTNEYTADRVNAMYQYMVSTQGEAAANIFRPALDVREEFFKAQYDEVIKVYGSIDQYATKGLGLSKEDIENLKVKMLIGYTANK